ncbi:unnamed protein product [Schistocephalus solidus]|uniref:Endoplasmic reticulum lectin 1 n=1 Tax=Schistocephalus solidus TaxID=70667 RepID=A0A183SYW0_SCHSO|nr:unnamed protein product [Schistocephalus solidus]
MSRYKPQLFAKAPVSSPILRTLNAVAFDLNDDVFYHIRWKEEEISRPAVPKSIHLNGRDLPYYESKFDNGTKCDLTGQPRKASVLYVCVENSVGDLFQIMETETCVYQLIVFTNSLCKSQKYSHRKPYSNVISCQAHDEKSPKQPRALEAFLKDKVSLSEDGEATLEGIFGNVHVKGLQVEKVQQGGSVVYRVRTRDTLDKSAKSAEEEYEEQEADITTSQEDRQLPPKVEAEQDPASEPPNFDLEGARTREIHSFLRGSTCLTGGLGWWKHEVCYGSKIVHYHEVIPASIYIYHFCSI